MAATYCIVDPGPALRRAMGGVPAQPAGPTLPVEIAIADGAGANRPRRKLLAGDLWITVHETANTNPGADARMHRQFVNGGGGPERVSFTFAVDKGRAVQILPLDEMGYHAGDGCDDPATDTGCFRSVSIETCVNDPAGSAGWAATKRNLAALVAGIVATPERFAGGAGMAGRFGFDRIEPHFRWSGKNCPQRMRAEGSLPIVVAEARAIAAGGGTTPPGPPAKQFPGDIPDDLILALFPAANPDLVRAPITRAWLAYAERTGQRPAFIRTATATGGAVFFVFDELVLVYKDGKVEEVAA